MKHKKKVSLNNKFFWAGLGVLAIVGVVGFATELDSVANSTHEFDNVYTYKSYNVDLKNIILEKTAFRSIGISIELSRYGQNAAAIGAALYYIEAFLSTVL